MQHSNFTHPLFYIRQHRVAMWIIAFVLFLQFVVFKWLYPHPNFMPDSYGYLTAAKDNSPISFWPVGYSMFLRLESIFTRNDIVLVLVQYLILQGCILYFLFGMAHLLQMPRKWLYILSGIFILNPAVILISNYVASDALFTSLSLLWFCLLLQLLVQPTARLVWWHAILIFILFTIRYNALFYPAISVLVLLVARVSWGVRIKGVLLMVLLMGVFVWHNNQEYKAFTGKAQFSPFGGWMLGGDALFMYSRLPRDKEAPPAKFAALQAVVNRHMDSLDTVKSRPDSSMGAYYIWNGPLLKFLLLTFKNSKDSAADYFKKWATMAPLYHEYGAYLIKKHPVAYTQHFWLPNAWNYFAPPGEFLKMYNQGSDSVGIEAVRWFGYKNGYVKAYNKKLAWAEYISVVNTLFNVIFLAALLGIVLLNGFAFMSSHFKQSLLLALAFVLLNFMFSVSLAPLVLRYQLFSFVLNGIFSVLLIKQIYQIGKLQDAKVEVGNEPILSTSLNAGE
ncbi:hypothetical protein SAMN05421788_10384 [Filimonas lacunae]|uniref:Dolichyl-phosphate-mannose-protein mannosyltransferase n=1 Tax=Filimonas lacunae TaxID=477680 RepID=A0A173MJC0_9BACT|nr:hypothetical protein [Filimonas lacunae]BAV07732.1 hypothetical protein FLA_3763 [Filimonas lacunae]SIT04188.1 hypothetical protein SAMN05421788_10384 [Filimonas lacunae]